MKKVRFLASDSEPSQKALSMLLEKYPQADLSAAELYVAIGGDGFLLRALHMLPHGSQVYGINTGRVGFLLNKIETNLDKALENPICVPLFPLTAEIQADGAIRTEQAFNDVSLTRSGSQATEISVHVDNKMYLKKLVADGILVSTPSGSTGYNQSAGGPILPLESNVLALTPICAFSPRYWRGAILPDSACIEFFVQNPDTRKAHVTLDFKEIKNVEKITVKKDTTKRIDLLFSPENSLKERVFERQFLIQG